MAKARWKQISDGLREEIERGDFKIGESLATEEALAARWSVSRMTAHRALQELQRQGLVARRQGSGTVVTARRAKVAGPVAILFHNSMNLLEIENLRGISAALGDEQQILFCDTRNEAVTEARQLRRARKVAAGIICSPTCAPENTPLLREIDASGFPLVCLDRVPEGADLDAVVSDNYAASARALRLATSRGHKYLAHFTHDILEVSSVRERLQAFTDVAREIGQPTPENDVRRFPRDVPSFEALCDLVQRELASMLAQPQPPTALFCVNEWLLAPLLEACAALQVLVPEDLDIVSFNDAPLLLPMMQARLTQISQRPHAIGHAAAERLTQKLSGESPEPRVLRIECDVLLPAGRSEAARAVSECVLKQDSESFPLACE